MAAATARRIEFDAGAVVRPAARPPRRPCSAASSDGAGFAARDDRRPGRTGSKVGTARPALRQQPGHLDRRAFAQVVHVRLVGQPEGGDRPARAARPAPARSAATANAGWASLTWRAWRISGVRSGAASTRNQGSTLMQCPPTPGPGRRMSTRGWRLARAIASQTSTPKRSARRANSLADGDVDVAVGVLHQLDHLGRRGVGQDDLAAHEGGVQVAPGLGRGPVDPADDAGVLDQLAQDLPGQDAFGRVGQVEIDARRSARSARGSGRRRRPSCAAARSIRAPPGCRRRRCGTIDSAAATTALRSARLSNRKGVGTAMMKASAGSGCPAMRRLPEGSAACTSVRSPGS